MNIESKCSLSQMTRKGKRVPERAREDEKESTENTKRVRSEDRRREEGVMKRQAEKAAG